jgi:hypothetical protein
MFRSRRRLHRLHRLHDLEFGSMPWSHAGWTPAGRRARGRRAPSILLILLAGLAAFALVKLMSAAERPQRSPLEKVLIAVLLVGAASFVLRLRRRGHRYAL